MFEKTTRLYIENLLLEKEFCNYLFNTLFEDKPLITLKKKSIIIDNNTALLHDVELFVVSFFIGRKVVVVANFSYRSTNERNMTRKTRSRQLSRIHSALRSGYCEICNITYNDFGDHIQTKKHLKLIGDDFITIQEDDNTFLNFNTATIDVLNGKNLNNCNNYYKKMLRTRTVSLCDRMKDSPLSPANSESGHHLRSRKNINYMTPPLEEDSLTEKPEVVVKEYRELRSSTRLLAKLADQMVENDDVWNSGRPKRTCIKQKRISADERLVVDNKSYYKVEVLAAKLRSSGAALKEVSKHLPTPPINNKVNVADDDSGDNNDNDDDDQDDDDDEDDDDKGLIVKFRKLRNSELIRLNNEAENFLFPKKDESSATTTEDEDDGGEEREEEEEDEDKDINNRKTNNLSTNNKNNMLLLSSDTEESQSLKKFKIIDDDSSMHSTSSESNNKMRKRRRTHAEAFIMDNQKYYKFETPGSRLRYQGSYLASVPQMKSPRNNGDYCSGSSGGTTSSSSSSSNVMLKTEKTSEQIDSNSSSSSSSNSDTKKGFPLNINEYKFSFEEVPTNDFWYQTFRRQDKGEERYTCFSDDYYFNSFILPYQIDYNIQPLDPQECINQYNQIKKYILESITSAASCSTPDPSTSNSASSIDTQFTIQDEDSKISATMTEISSVSSTLDEIKVIRPKKRGPKPKDLSGNNNSGGKNPRKSPRQHASTLAILSSLIHQRKKRKSPTGGGNNNNNNNKIRNNLPAIIEETNNRKSPSKTTPNNKRQRSATTTTTINNDNNNDYMEIVKVIDEELAASCDDNYMDFLDEETVAAAAGGGGGGGGKTDDDCLIDFNNKVDVVSILATYDQKRAKEDSRGTKRFFNGGTPGRKPGRKKKKNRTGWPNRNKRIFVRKDQLIVNNNKDDYLDDSTIDSLSVNAEDTDDEICEEIITTTTTNSTDSINNKKKLLNSSSVGKLINNTNTSSVVVIDSNNVNNINNTIIEENVIINNCDLITTNNLSSDRVNEHDYNNINSSVDNNIIMQKNNQTVTDNNKVLTTKVNNSGEQFNIDLQFQPYVRVQKLDSEQMDLKIASPPPPIPPPTPPKRSNSPKRTNRGQRRMPASPKSPRMLRRPRGRWYRER